MSPREVYVKNVDRNYVFLCSLTKHSIMLRIHAEFINYFMTSGQY